MTFPAPTTGPTPNVMPGAAAAAPSAPPAAAAAAPAPGATAVPAVPAAPTPTALAAAQAVPADPPAPPWGSDAEFNPETAWNLIQNLRGDNTGLKDKLAAAQPVLDAADQQRRDEQGALATAQEDIARAQADAAMWRNQVVRTAAQKLAGDNGFGVPDAALAMIGDLADYTTATGLDEAKLTARFEQLATQYPGLVTPVTPPPPAALEPQWPYGMTPNLGPGQAGPAPSILAEKLKAAQDRGDFTQVIALRQQMAYQAQQHQ